MMNVTAEQVGATISTIEALFEQTRTHTIDVPPEVWGCLERLGHPMPRDSGGQPQSKMTSARFNQLAPGDVLKL